MTSPARAVFWILLGLLSLWTTNYDTHLDGVHRSSFFGLTMASAHPLPFPPPHGHSATTNSTTEETRAFVDSLFTAVALDNFGQSFAAALSDNLTWTVSGSSPIAGKYVGKQAYIDEVLTPLREVLVSLPVPIVEHVVVDGDWAVVNWRSEGVEGKNGVDYDMQYAWLMRTELEEAGRKIVEVIGFYDGEKVTAVFEGYVFNRTRV